MSTPTGYVATAVLKFGDRRITPGQPVPIEPGRNYPAMVRLGQIAPTFDKPAAGEKPGRRRTASADAE